jgi:alanine dehydrogenase
MTSVVARTATHAFNNAAWPFMWEIASAGISAALSRSAALREGVMLHDGHVTHPALAAALGVQEARL